MSYLQNIWDAFEYFLYSELEDDLIYEDYDEQDSELDTPLQTDSESESESGPGPEIPLHTDSESEPEPEPEIPLHTESDSESEPEIINIQDMISDGIINTSEYPIGIHKRLPQTVCDYV